MAVPQAYMVTEKVQPAIWQVLIISNYARVDHHATPIDGVPDLLSSW